MRQFLVTTILGAMLLGVAPHAGAFGGRFMGGHGGGPGGGGPGGPAGLPLRLLVSDMTPDQRKQVREILMSDRAELRDILRQLRAAHDALGDRLFTAGPLTEKDLDPDVQKISALHQKLLEHGTKVMLQVRAIATPEQLAKAAQTKKRLGELKDEMRALFGHGADDDVPPEDLGQ
ncbi:MAG TPA: periplasmic heavy metal sensor [Candidatus Eisenbacteria bacterium]|nr:periplasmic heavy metal sensor [Candidatus Eisenbacteria bacterium]